MEQLHCNRCGHQWLPRKLGGLPVACPTCRRRDWNKPVVVEVRK